MKNLKVLIVLLALVILIPGASISARSFAKMYEECGLGGLIFLETDYPIVGMISNITWDLGTTATSSNVSNTCANDSAKVADFIYESYVNLEEETVRGDGTHLQALLTIAGCQESARPMLIQSIRGEFSKSLMEKDYFGKSRFSKSENYYNIFQKQVGASSSCAFST